MKKLLTVLALIILLVSCETPGTIYKPDQGNHPKYNIEKYFYDDNNNYIIIATRKDSLPVTNITWEEKHGKTTETKSVVIDDNRPIKYKDENYFVYSKKDILMENDSIVIIRK